MARGSPCSWSSEPELGLHDPNSQLGRSCAEHAHMHRAEPSLDLFRFCCDLFIPMQSSPGHKVPFLEHLSAMVFHTSSVPLKTRPKKRLGDSHGPRGLAGGRGRWHRSRRVGERGSKVAIFQFFPCPVLVFKGIYRCWKYVIVLSRGLKQMAAIGPSSLPSMVFCFPCWF